MKVVFCTAPLEAAQNLASTLVGERLAACVNVNAGLTSVYRWQGEIEVAREALLVIKTSDAALARLVARIQETHPYEVPEIVVLDVAQVNENYLGWVDAETRVQEISKRVSKESAASDDEGSVRGASPRAVTRSSITEGTMAKKKAAKKAAKKSTAKKTKKKR